MLISSRWSTLWIAWIMVILLVGVLPLSNFVGHSHWEYIKWVPTAEQLGSPLVLLDLTLDALANIVLFMPFGFFYAGRLQTRSGSSVVLIILALALSFGIELYQVYCHNRSTSLLDVIDNVAGAYVGWRVGGQFFEKAPSVEARRVATISSP
ncbi:MAG TPA: VanZ family protein [Nitrospiraceae bacterium]|nr:VanZ family protein [Nitrospiraceae bacterium]